MRDRPTRFRYVDSDRPWIRVLYVPLFVVAVLLHWARPLRVFPEPWIGHVIGWPLLALAVLVAMSSHAQPGEVTIRIAGRRLLRRRIYAALPIAYLAAAAMVNSVWPLILLPAGVFLVIRMLHVQGPGWVDPARR